MGVLSLWVILRLVHLAKTIFAAHAAAVTPVSRAPQPRSQASEKFSSLDLDVFRFWYFLLLWKKLIFNKHTLYPSSRVCWSPRVAWCVNANIATRHANVRTRVMVADSALRQWLTCSVFLGRGHVSLSVLSVPRWGHVSLSLTSFMTLSSLSDELTPTKDVPLTHDPSTMILLLRFKSNHGVRNYSRLAHPRQLVDGVDRFIIST